MQHAQMGFRDTAKSLRAYAEIYECCAEKGVVVDRYGIALDWSMGFPRDRRRGQLRGTGLILDGPEDFAALTARAPVAPHFGDFVLGFPAALENTQAALAAGATVIGNLGQHFTFLLPGWRDDVATTRATLEALGLIAAQPVEVLVHSNLDDGFAAVFTDLACALGAALIERHIVEDLIGARITHCYGHHMTSPVLRLAFQQALAEASPNPGSMIYGNITAYRGGAAENYASLSRYLTVDILAQQRQPSGHAINPVPVTENRRIPDIEEIIDAQLFAGWLVALGPGIDPLFDPAEAARCADTLLAGGRRFQAAVLSGLAEAGIDTADPFELLLALRRIGGKRLEELFGPGAADAGALRRRAPLVLSDTVREIQARAQECLARLDRQSRVRLAGSGLRVALATTDVHEHGKLLLEEVLRALGLTLIEGGVSADPDSLAERAQTEDADLIALSTYNGVALTYFTRLQAELTQRRMEIPVLIGGRLNQIPEGSNSSLPTEVGDELAAAGAIVCETLEAALPALLAAAEAKSQ